MRKGRGREGKRGDEKGREGRGCNEGRKIRREKRR